MFVAGLVVNRLLLSAGRITPDQVSMLEFYSTACIIICYAGVGLDSRFYQIDMLETSSTESIIVHYCYPVLETGSMVVPEPSSTLNIKVQRCSSSLLRGHRILLIATATFIGALCTSSPSAVTLCATGYAMLVR